MTGNNITQDALAAMIDHAILRPEATRDEMRAACALAEKYPLAAVCVRPSDVAEAASLLAGTKTAAAAVVGFPHGAATTTVKVAEAAQAVAEGAAELDMVINIGRLRSGEFDFVRDDIAAVAAAAEKRTVKVILECCYLDGEQMAAACRAAIDADAHFVKTSTGFGRCGATVESVRFLRRTVGKSMGVKAAGGIATLADALAMIDAGANRIGTSKTAQILAELGLSTAAK
ncbi:MAG: deoxyribose-phosphate aldolase [Phycisphaerae bacterium]|nr:deoxyribose-phosphate aldolase [Phycisphaerae bacterium]